MLPLTRAWDDGDEARPAREAGSYFKHNSPLRQDLYLDAPRGERRSSDHHHRPAWPR
ncbi:hypothetical protein [Phyllobacterium endophyticum]|uniref:hypothetical protein n=1 Tax=Phyllobacterium endophyticum TaxID=1149773 RepID=UPI0016504222|nr:hypothetical protein [Phyllobacterium endophyticum]